MTNDQIKVAQPLSLFRFVFGMQPNQTLTEFQKECAPIRDDTKFIEEVREYALTNNPTP